MPLKMSNATAVYAIMLLVFATGLWAILAYGSTLQAPPDLAGEWELIALDTATSVPASRPSLSGDPMHGRVRMQLEQSGRFVRLTVMNQPSMQLRIQWSAAAAPIEGAIDMPIELRGATGNVRFHPTANRDEFRISFEAPNRAAYVGRLVNPTHARAASATSKARRAAQASARNAPRDTTPAAEGHAP